MAAWPAAVIGTLSIDISKVRQFKTARAAIFCRPFALVRFAEKRGPAYGVTLEAGQSPKMAQIGAKFKPGV
jgi:hypothetical protein